MTNELERLAARAEMMPLLRTHGGLILSREGKELQGALRREVADAIRDKARVALKTDLAFDVMDSLCEVDAYRRVKANGDEILNSLLADAEVTHALTLGRIQRS